MSSTESLEVITSGYRLPSPRDCPPEICNIMTSCWRELPEERPSFKQILQTFDQIATQYGFQSNQPSYQHIDGTEEPVNCNATDQE